jgi:hypothetical protein
MIKYALPVAVLYLGVVSAAWALPGSLSLPASPNDIVQVGSKSKGKSQPASIAIVKM